MTDALFRTYRQAVDGVADTIAGLTPGIIRYRVRRGLLPASPWTRVQIIDHFTAHPLYIRRNPSTDVSRWRAGHRDIKARTAHNTSSRQLRRRHSDLTLTSETRDRILASLRSGQHLQIVCEDLDIPVQRVWGRTRWDTQWKDQLNATLDHMRDPALDHGDAGTYRIHRCLCTECRAAKAVERSGKQPEQQ